MESPKCNNCLGILALPIVMSCSHSLCFYCYELLENTNSLDCPFCRKKILTAVPCRDWAEHLDSINEGNEDYAKLACRGYPEELLKRPYARAPNIDNPRFRYTPWVVEIKGKSGNHGSDVRYLCRFNDDHEWYLTAAEIREANSDSADQLLKDFRKKLNRNRVQQHRLRQQVAIQEAAIAVEALEEIAREDRRERQQDPDYLPRMREERRARRERRRERERSRSPEV